MKKFGRETTKKSSISKCNIILFSVYVCVLIISFTIFLLYAKITGWIFSKNKIDIFNDLQGIARYFWVVDPEIANQLLTFDDIVKDYLQGDNVLQTREKELTQLREYAKDHREYLSKSGFGNYERILKMLETAWPLKEEIFQLLGKNERFNYLVPLQNSNEKRPNGGFFGSFAFVGIYGGHIVDLQIVDSYLPDLLSPHTRILLPDRTQGFLSEKSAGFIAGNKYGFTDKDGINLKILYEKIFHYEYDPIKKEQLFNPEKWNQLFEKNIKGVIFLDSELILYLMPSFREKAWEWQFVNANIDLIRGEDSANKKELYINDLENYLKSNALKLTQATIDSVQDLLNKGYVNIFLSNVSDQMRGFLEAYNLTTIYDPSFWYFFNINTSYNKADGFVKKQIEILDEGGNVLLATDEKKLDVSSLLPGIYTISLSYELDVPKTYQDAMKNLEEKYNIKMTDRERHILALQPENPDPTQPLKWRETQEVIYLPKKTRILSMQGDIFSEKEFESDFSKGVSYQSRISSNQVTNLVKIKLEILQ